MMNPITYLNELRDQAPYAGWSIAIMSLIFIILILWKTRKNDSKNIDFVPIIKLGVIISIIVILVLIGIKYYFTMAEERGCGYNPIKHIPIMSTKECWCCGDIEVNDCDTFVCENNTKKYFGFTCKNCSELCKSEQNGVFQYN